MRKPGPDAKPAPEPGPPLDPQRAADSVTLREVASAATVAAPSTSTFSVPAPSASGPIIRIHTGSLEASSDLEAVSGAQTAYAADQPPLPPQPKGAPDPLVGKTVDHFFIRGRIGQGGMGTVYLAHDQSLDRPVALKFLRPDLASEPHLVDNLIAEARAQARLQHPHVVTIYFIGRHQGVPYLAMEYVRGKSLDEHLQADGPIPWVRALEHVIDAVKALHAAHKRGIVHRDIKPSNLILATTDHRGGLEPEVMVADFGLAARTGGGEGAFIGTPHYASPEQIAGAPLDHRSDIYALGITFWELLTARRPFEGRTLEEIFVQHRAPTRPELPEDKAPPRLRGILREMMDADPARRPQDYDTLLRRLQACRPVFTAAGGILPRGIALAIDLTVLAITGQLLHGVLPLSQVAANSLALALFAAYYVIGHKLFRKTLGKRMMGLALRGVRRAPSWKALGARFLVEFWGPVVALIMLNLQLGAATDLESVRHTLTDAVGVQRIPILDDSLQALLRTVLVPNVVLALPWLGGFLVALFVGQRQALHDLVAGTRVVVSHESAPPSSAKR